MSLLRVVEAGSPTFESELASLAQRGASDLSRVEPAVKLILEAVRSEGDPAVLRFVERFESRKTDTVLLRNYGGKDALAALDPAVRGALEQAAGRIEAYHRRQVEQLASFEYAEGGVRLGSRVTPLDRVGLYVPGGKAPYPSSVLMTAVIAKVAGVREVLVATPDPNPEVRAACHLAGVKGIVYAGGAQAIGALAYGTQTVPRVDKIVGPGNIYVAAAKRLVFGDVAIDSIAGPSEILVVADDSADAAVVAADLLSQAEHDEAAYALLLTTSRELVSQVEVELERQVAELPREGIARASLAAHGCVLIVKDEEQLATTANRIACEHVAVQTREPRSVASRILRAGALFIGHSTPEAAGDYLAGPSHVLPTGGAARFSAPLGAYDFVSRTSMIEYEPSALRDQSASITGLARVEGFEAHARAVDVRTRR